MRSAAPRRFRRIPAPSLLPGRSRSPIGARAARAPRRSRLRKRPRPAAPRRILGRLRPEVLLFPRVGAPAPAGRNPRRRGPRVVPDGGASQPRAVRVRAAARAHGSVGDSARLDSGGLRRGGAGRLAAARVRHGRRALRARAMTGLLPSLATSRRHPARRIRRWILARAGALVPAGRAGERVAWGFLLGVLLLAGYVPIALAVGGRPGWLALGAAAILVLAASRAARTRRPTPRRRRHGRDADSRASSSSSARQRPAACFSMLLRALTEPMWAADFLAIWGWKGKVIFGARGFSPWTWTTPRARVHASGVSGRPAAARRRNRVPARALGRPRPGPSVPGRPGRDAPPARVLARRRGLRRSVALAAAAALASSSRSIARSRPAWRRCRCLCCSSRSA